jgi:hypothetical protein
MQIKKEISFTIEKESDNVIVYGLQTVGFLLGTTSFNGDWKLRKHVTKKGNKYIVPKSLVEERLKIFYERRKDIQQKIELMEQVVNNGRNKSKRTKK